MASIDAARIGLTRVGTDDPIAYVMSANLHRRQLTPSQRAMVAARARKYYETEAAKRQREGQERGRQSQRGAMVENLPPSAAGKARDKAGKAAGVSGKVDLAELAGLDPHPRGRGSFLTPPGEGVRRAIGGLLYTRRAAFSEFIAFPLPSTSKVNR